MSDDYPNRRRDDALLVQTREDVAALATAQEKDRDWMREEMAALRKELHEDLTTIRTDVRGVRTVIERGKVVAWVLSSMGGLALVLEHEWQVITRFVKSFRDGGDGGA